jgi:hypothetical protein
LAIGIFRFKDLKSIALPSRAVPRIRAERRGAKHDAAAAIHVPPQQASVLVVLDHRIVLLVVDATDH